MKTLHALIAIAAGGLLGSTSTQAGELPDTTRLVQANNAFGLRVLRTVHREGKNTCVSPSSMAMALHMAAEGAEGPTRSELLRAQQVEGLSLGALNRDLLGKLDSKSVTLRVANSIWAPQHGGALLPRFAAGMAQNFNAQVHTVDMGDPATVQQINGWIKKTTEGLIPRLIDEIPSDAATYLISAVAFKGAWSTAFAKADTRPGEFQLQDGRKHQVQLMRQTANLACLHDGTTSVVRLPYGKDEAIGMWIAVPDSPTGLAKLVDTLSPETLAGWKRTVRKQPCDLSLPRFSMRSTTPLKAALQALGVKTAFDPQQADFSRMAEGGEGLFISRVLHETQLEVSEEGTQAGAATAVEIAPGGMPLSVSCDRPFAILIEDRATSAILFVATVYRP